MTTHEGHGHPNTKAARAECRRENKIANDAEGIYGPTRMLDNLGVVIQPGDRIIINAWGGNVRLTDVGSRGTVEGFSPTRVRVVWDGMTDLPAGVIRPDTIAVLRRDGRDGLQGNVDR